MKVIGWNSLKNAIITIFLGLIVSSLSTFSIAQTNSNLLINPGLENGNFKNWVKTQPVSVSDKAHSGSKSAKISGHSGRISQNVAVTPNTDYQLSAYVLNFGRIGVLIDGDKEEKRIHAAEEWTKAEVEFNSGSANFIEVYVNFYREEGRYDDFVLAPKNAIALSASTLLTQCPEIGTLPIAIAYDDGTHDNNPPENVIDGNLSNRWSSKGSGKTITFDLNQIAEVSQLDVMWYKGKERISLFSVETSTDGKNWKMILADTSSTITDGFDSYDIQNLISPDARFVRIIGGGNSSSEWNSISEVRIKGCVR